MEEDRDSSRGSFRRKLGSTTQAHRSNTYKLWATASFAEWSSRGLWQRRTKPRAEKTSSYMTRTGDRGRRHRRPCCCRHQASLRYGIALRLPRGSAWSKTRGRNWRTWRNAVGILAFEAAFEDFKLRFDNVVDQLSQDQRSARKRKRIHAYLTQVFGHHHGMWVSLQTGGMPRLRLLCFPLNARWARLLNST